MRWEENNYFLPRSLNTSSLIFKVPITTTSHRSISVILYLWLLCLPHPSPPVSWCAFSSNLPCLEKVTTLSSASPCLTVTFPVTQQHLRSPKVPHGHTHPMLYLRSLSWCHGIFKCKLTWSLSRPGDSSVPDSLLPSLKWLFLSKGGPKNRRQDRSVVWSRCLECPVFFSSKHKIKL